MADLGSFVFGTALGIVGGFFMAAEIEKRGGIAQLLPAGGPPSAPKYVQRVDTRDDRNWLLRAEKLGRKHKVDRIKFLMPGECIGSSGLVTKGTEIVAYWHGIVPSKLPWCFDRDGQA